MLFRARYKWVVLTCLPPAKPHGPEEEPLGCWDPSQTRQLFRQKGISYRAWGTHGVIRRTEEVVCGPQNTAELA